LTVCGSFGFGNAGDEAIPYAIADIATHLGLSVDLDVVGRFDEPALTGVIGMGTGGIRRREELRGQPIVVTGGGIIENNPRAVIFACEEFLNGTFTERACLYGISTEPGVVYGWRCKRRLLSILKRFDKVFTRDCLSERILNEMFPRVKTETIGDIVLWMHPSTDDIPSELKLPERFIVVNLTQNWSKESEWRAWVSTELHALSKELEMPLVFVPMTDVYDDDRVEHRSVAAEIANLKPEIAVEVILENLNPRAISAIVGRADLVVSMRLHGCVMAYAQQTPSVALAYHPKIDGFLSTVDLRGAMLPRQTPPKQSEAIYGYRFSDLNICPGDLVRVATDSLSRPNFSKLPVLKARSAAVLHEFVSTF
jgi:polysaccharide pyruvyl transferase WcaK-like protein